VGVLAGALVGDGDMVAVAVPSIGALVGEGVSVGVSVGVAVGVSVGVSVGVGEAASPNVAVSCVAWLIVTLHMSLPAHAPLQPRKVEPACGFAVSITTVPAAYVSAQSLPQVIPAGALVTVPLPAPSLSITSVYPATTLTLIVSV